MAGDILIYESGNGGEVVIRGNDIVTVNGVENTPYLSMFGGADWWGNYLIPESPFLCQTEQVLKKTPLTSAGRITILNAINADLGYLNDIEGTKWNVQLFITNPNRLDIIINIDGQVFAYQWNPDTLYLTYQV